MKGQIAAWASVNTIAANQWRNMVLHFSDNNVPILQRRKAFLPFSSLVQLLQVKGYFL